MVIFLYGEDAFRSRQKLSEIREKYLQSDKSGSGLSSFEADETKNLSERLKEALFTSNLFESKRLLICKNLITLGSDNEKDSMLEFIKKNKKLLEEDKDLVVIFWEGGSPKKNGALYKFLVKEAKKQEFERLSGVRLNQWILKRLKELDVRANISGSALEKLVAYTSGNSCVLDKEIQKLASYADGKMIGDEDVDRLVKASLDNNIFKTIDALGANDKKEAMKLIHAHLESGDDPFYLMSMFVYQFRNMLKVADLKERRALEYEIAKMTKLHPFVIKKSLAQIGRFPFSRLEKIYRRLGIMDLMVKTGKIDIRLALDKFVAEL